MVGMVCSTAILQNWRIVLPRLASNTKKEMTMKIVPGWRRS